MNSGCTETGRVLAVHRSVTHSFSKTSVADIELVAGLGVRGDAHAGATVRHRSRVARDPTAPNLRQIHLIAVETLSGLIGSGFDVHPGDLGENITTEGVELTTLLTETRLEFDGGCVVEVTGLRNPCGQIDDYCPGLLDQVRTIRNDGSIDRRAGIMGIVIVGGRIAPGEQFSVVGPPSDGLPLVVV